jgi:hypothetical protein
MRVHRRARLDGQQGRVYDMLGRTYKVAGLYVRIVRVDADGVTFGSAVKDVKLVNAYFTHAEFAELELEEATSFDYDMRQMETRSWQ